MTLGADSAAVDGSGVGAAPGLVTDRRHRSVWAWPLAIVGVAVVIGATVVATVLLANDPTPTQVTQPTESLAQTDPSLASEPADPTTADLTRQAAGQAAAIDRILSDSVASRRKLTAALRQVSGCGNVSGALADLREVGAERDSQLATLADLDVSVLPDGERLRALLRSALTYSLEADRSYVRWAQAVESGSCPNSGAGHRAEGDRLSGLAGDNKYDFLAVWNQTATEYGLTPRTRDDI